MLGPCPNCVRVLFVKWLISRITHVKPRKTNMLCRPFHFKQPSNRRHWTTSTFICCILQIPVLYGSLAASSLTHSLTRTKAAVFRQRCYTDPWLPPHLALQLVASVVPKPDRLAWPLQDGANLEGGEVCLLLAYTREGSPNCLCRKALWPR